MLHTDSFSTNDELRYHTHGVAHNCPHLCSLVSLHEGSYKLSHMYNNENR